MEEEEEIKAINSLQEEQTNLSNEKHILSANFTEFKSKLMNRIEQIELEKSVIEQQKKSFDENAQKDMELRKAKLVDILVIIHQNNLNK